MNPFGEPKWVGQITDDRIPLERKLDMGHELWNSAEEDAYFNLKDPRLSHMESSIIRQIAESLYGPRSKR